MRFNTERTIKEGSAYRIHPSMALMGIEEGVVIVESINPSESLTTQQKLERKFYTEGYTPEEEVEAYAETWITAEYVNKEVNGFIHLPAEVFAEHITCY